MRDVEPRRRTTVRFRDAIWRLGGSSWSFFFLSFLLAAWVLVGTTIPQLPIRELQGIASVEMRQIINLFQANTVAYSWFTYLLLTLLLINSLGMVFAKRLGPTSSLLGVAVILCGTAFYLSTHTVQRGTVWVREGGNNPHTDFRVIVDGHTGQRNITLPFSLMCPPQHGASLDCVVQYAKTKERQTITIHTPGNGVSTVGAYRLSWTQSKVAQRPQGQTFDIKPPAPWVHLEARNGGGLVCANEPCPRSQTKDPAPASIGSLKLGNWFLSYLSVRNEAAVFVANGPDAPPYANPVWIGLDARLGEGPDVPVGDARHTAHLPSSVRAPRWLGMSFVRVPENPLHSGLYWIHPALVLIGIYLLILLLWGRGREKTG